MVVFGPSDKVVDPHPVNAPIASLLTIGQWDAGYAGTWVTMPREPWSGWEKSPRATNVAL